MADDIIAMMDKAWDLTEDKLAKMISVLEGRILPAPGIGKCVECKIVSSPTLSNKQKESGVVKGMPFVVVPFIPDGGEKEMYKTIYQTYNIIADKEYTFFINKATYYQLRPWLAMLKIRDFQALRGMYIKVCGDHWKEAKEGSMVSRDLDGRAISIRIKELRFPTDKELEIKGDAAKLMDMGSTTNTESTVTEPVGVDQKTISDELFKK